MAASPFGWATKLLAALFIIAIHFTQVQSQCTITCTNVVSATCVVCEPTILVTAMPTSPENNVTFTIYPSGKNASGADAGLIDAEIMLMYDQASYDSRNDISNMKTQVGNFVSCSQLFRFSIYFRLNMFPQQDGFKSVKVGYSLCETFDAISYRATVYYPLTTNTVELYNAIDSTPSTKSNYVPSAGPQCIGEIMRSANSGWGKASFKAVVFLTSVNIQTTYDLSRDIYDTAIIPIFYLPTALQAAWDIISSYVATLPFAYAKYGSIGNGGKFQDWATGSANAIKTSAHSVLLLRSSPTPIANEFIKNLSQYLQIGIAQANASTQITLQFPSRWDIRNITSAYGDKIYGSVTALGYGVQTYEITLVRPPSIPSSAVVPAILQETKGSFAVPMDVPSLRTSNMTFMFTSINHSGIMYEAVTVATPTTPLVQDRWYTNLPASTQWYFQGDFMFWGSTWTTVVLYDQCQYSYPGNVTIPVTHVNKAPVALSSSITIPYNSVNSAEQRISFASLISDLDDPVANLQIILTGLSFSTKIGDLKADNTSFPVISTFPYYLGTARTVLFVPLPFKNGTTTLRYQVSDGAATSQVATITITVGFVNTAPVFTVYPSTTLVLDAAQELQKTFSMVGFDPDDAEQMSLIVTAQGTGNNSLTPQVISPLNGYAQVTGSSSFPAYLFLSKTVASTGYVNFNLTWLFTAPTQYTYFPTFTVVVQDKYGAYSANQTIVLSIIPPPVVCDPGYYLPSLNSTECVRCPDGYSSTGGTITTCSIICPEGQYSNATSGGVCSLCPAGTYSLPGSPNCTVCAPGSTSTVGSGSCSILCGIGEYSNSSTNGVCFPCPDGSIAPQQNSSFCSICPPGTREVTSTACQNCPAGSSSPGFTSVCTPCPYGQYSNATTGYICQFCPTSFIPNANPGTSCVTCKAGYYTYNYTCVLCPNGTASAAGSSSLANCIPCPSGNYSNSVTLPINFRCLSCPINSIPNSNRSDCNTCPAGTISNSTACNLCPAGQTRTDLATNVCVPCPVQTYSNVTTSSICLSCPANMIPNPSNTLCIPCDIGYYANYPTPNTTRAVCTPCGDGYSSPPASVLADCYKCPTGQYSNSSSLYQCATCGYGYVVNSLQSACQICPAGTYKLNATYCMSCSPGNYSNPGSEACTPCATGFYSSAATNFKCLECAPGNITNSDQSGCIQCTPGYYESNNNNVCQMCPAGNGTGATQYGATSCLACTTGFYSNSSTLGICYNCPAGWVVNATVRATGCKICPAGTYKESETTCTMCPPGYGTSFPGSTVCTPCPVGQYSNATTGGVCQYCDPGYVPDAQNKSCIACQVGRYELNDVCLNCVSGNTSGLASTNCTACPPGQFSSLVETNLVCKNCLEGEYSNANRSDCDLCPPGNTSVAGTAGSAAECTACPPNTYSNAQRICTPCPAGQIPTGAADGSGNTSCATCPAGTYEVDTYCQQCPFGSSAPGSYLESQCTNCSVGYFSNSSALCEPCPEGYFSIGTNCSRCPDGTTADPGSISSALNCTACVTDQYSSETTKGICLTCPNGTVPNAAKNDCVSCPLGWFESPATGACTRCPDGQTTNATGSWDISNCTLCPEGDTSSAASAGECYACAAHTYSNGSRICVECAINEVSQPGSNSCSLCPPGTKALDNACVFCDSGTSSSEGSIECTPCNATTYSNSSTSFICQMCPPGQVPNDLHNDCLPCPVGYYESGGYCVMCPPGNGSTVEGVLTCDPCGPRNYSNYETLGICQECPAGEISNATSSGCTACQPGTYQLGNVCENCTAGNSSSVPATQCTPCIDEVYSNATTGFICVPCPDGYQVNPEKSGCDICLAGQQDLGTCQPCAAGNTSTPGSTSCFPCPVGQYSNSSTSFHCSFCPDYYVVNSDQTGCDACPSGQIKLNETTCQACPNGYSSWGTGECFICEIGQYSNPATQNLCLNCTAGTYANTNNSECLICPNGTTSFLGFADNATMCFDCLPGEISSVRTGGLCFACPAGEVPNADRSECLACPVGTYRYNETYCSICDPGNTTPNPGSPDINSCEPCNVFGGLYSNASTNGLCLPCPAGTYSTGSQCILCPGGTTSLPGDPDRSQCTSCTDFGPDYYSNATTGGICLQCPPGTIPTNGLSQCTACLVGQYEVNGRCLSCPNGYSSSIGSNGSLSCYLCDPGEYSSFTPSASLPSTNGECLPCPAGTYAQNGLCTVCPPGNVSAVNSTICIGCPEGQYSNTNNTICLICPDGRTTVTLTGSVDKCTICPIGTYSNQSTLGVCKTCPYAWKPNDQRTGCVPDPKPPVIDSTAITVFQGQSKSFNLTAYDRDPGDYLNLKLQPTAIFPNVGNPLLVGFMQYAGNNLAVGSLMEPPTYTDAATNTSSFLTTFASDDRFYGLTRMDYTALDGYPWTAAELPSASVTVDIRHVNHAPTSADFSVGLGDPNLIPGYAGVEDSTLYIGISSNLANFPAYDWDATYFYANNEPDQFSILLVSVPDAATVGVLRLDPNPDPLQAGDVIPKSTERMSFEPVDGQYNANDFYTTVQFRICDNSGASNNCSVETYTMFIYILPHNHPPTCSAMFMEVDQNSINLISFSGYDRDSWDAGDLGVLLRLDSVSHGNFYMDPDMLVPYAFSNATYDGFVAPQKLWYAPGRNTFSERIGGNVTIKFSVKDANVTTLPPYAFCYLSLRVNHVPQPPEFIDPDSGVVDVLENVPKFIFLGSDGNWWADYNIGFGGTYLVEIIRPPARGSLSICEDDFVCNPLVWAGANVTVLHPSGMVIYTPETDTFGTNYTTFDIKVTDPNVGLSSIATVYINVIHVNQPPKIVNASWVNGIVANESSSAVFYFSVIDVDTTPDKVHVELTTRPVSSKFDYYLYSCTGVGNVTACERVEQKVAFRDSTKPLNESVLAALNARPPSASADSTTCVAALGEPFTDFSGCYSFYKLEFVPQPAKSGTWGYLLLSAVSQRDNDLTSDARSSVMSVPIVVNPVNSPPEIRGGNDFVGAENSLQVPLKGISVFDADAYNFRVTLRVALLNDSTLNGTMKPCDNVTANADDGETAAWVCTGTVTTLNRFLNSSVWTFATLGDRDNLFSKLRLTVNDNGATSPDDNGHPQTASKDITVRFTYKSASIITPNEASPLLWLLMLLLLFAIIAIAIAIWYYKNRTKPPSDDYFAVATTSTLNAAKENPLFVAAAKEGFSKLYTPRDMAPESSAGGTTPRTPGT